MSDLNGRTKLAAKLAAAAADIGTVPKSGRNRHHQYDYASDADVFRSVRGPLAAHGIAMVSSVSSVDRVEVGSTRSGTMWMTTVVMTITLICSETGEQIVSQAIGTGSDSQDKGLYKAITGALKYWCKATFLLPTGDDPEEDHPQQSRQQSKPLRSQGLEDVAKERLAAAAHQMAEAYHRDLSSMKRALWGAYQEMGDVDDAISAVASDYESSS